MQIVILAGGLATRMRPVTEKMPKAMIEVCGKPFLEHQVELLKKNGIHDIVLCVGYLAGQIKDHFGDGSRFGVRISYSEETEGLLGTGGALKKAEGLLEKEFFLMYGDSYLPIAFMDVLKRFRECGRLGLMTVYRNMGRYGKSNVVVEGGMVAEYDKNKKDSRMEYIDYGLSMLSKKALSGLPEDGPFALDLLYKKLIKERQLCAFETGQRFYEIGSPEGLADLEAYLSANAQKRQV